MIKFDFFICESLIISDSLIEFSFTANHCVKILKQEKLPFGVYSHRKMFIPEIKSAMSKKIRLRPCETCLRP